MKKLVIVTICAVAAAASLYFYATSDIVNSLMWKALPPVLAITGTVNICAGIYLIRLFIRQPHYSTAKTRIPLILSIAADCIGTFLCWVDALIIRAEYSAIIKATLSNENTDLTTMLSIIMLLGFCFGIAGVSITIYQATKPNNSNIKS
jgi:hypothetical protein